MQEIYILSELDLENNMIESFATSSKKPALSIIKNFKFASGKSLKKFLQKYESDIYNCIPPGEMEVLDKLEAQKFLESDEYISPDDVLDVWFRYGVGIEEKIMKYILKEVTNEMYREYSYSLRFVPVYDS
jgi:hypothetical protein